MARWWRRRQEPSSSLAPDGLGWLEVGGVRLPIERIYLGEARGMRGYVAVTRSVPTNGEEGPIFVWSNDGHLLWESTERIELVSRGHTYITYVMAIRDLYTPDGAVDVRPRVG